MRLEADIETYKVSFIDYSNMRDEAAQKLISHVKECLYLLSKKCRIESVAIMVPLDKGPSEEVYACGPRSMMALRDLMDDKYYDKIKLSALTEWNFDRLPTADINKIYVDCFHSLARESKFSYHIYLYSIIYSN